jgi:hypothetical protein
MSGGRLGAFWPSQTQRQLLAVALGTGEEALAAWQAIRPALDLDNLEPGSFALLPLVYHTLAEAGSDDPLLPRLKGIHRNTWVRNNLLLERAGDTALALEAADIRPLFVGGTFFASRFFPNVGLRPTTAVELLIDSGHAASTCAHLAVAGWTFRSDITEGPAGPRYFSDPHENLCIVRTALGFDFALAGDVALAHAPLWENAEPQQLRAGGSPLFPAPTEALLVALVLGARRKPTPSIVWILDTVMILRYGADRIDWQRFFDLGLPRGQGLRIRETLAYVSGLPQVDVPRSVLDRLAATPVSFAERLIYAGAAGSAARLGALPEVVAEQLVESADHGPVHAIRSVPARLRARWGLRSSSQLPAAAGRRALRRIAGRTGT